MVAPLVVGAGRVIAKSASRIGNKTTNKKAAPDSTPLKKASRPDTSSTKSTISYASQPTKLNRLPRRTQRGKTIGQQRQNKQRTTYGVIERMSSAKNIGRYRQLQHARRALRRKNDYLEISSMAGRRARVISILMFFIPMYIVPYGVQVGFGLLYIQTTTTWYFKALDSFSGWVVNDLVGSTLDLTISQLSQYIIFIIGGVSLLVAAFWCAAYRVRLSSPFVYPFGIAIALAGSYAPYLFFLPWPLLWLLVVLWTQK